MLKIIYGLLLIYLLTTEASIVVDKNITSSSSNSSVSSSTSKNITKNITKNTTDQSSILSQLTGDQNVCPVSSVIKTSKFTQVCGNLTLPTESNVTSQNINQFLCSAVWHKAVKLCNHTKTKSPNLAELDPKVGNFLAQDPGFEIFGKVCRHWRINETFRYEKTQKFVDDLSVVLRKDKTCMDLCVEKDRLRGLCVLIYFMDQAVDDLLVTSSKKVQDEKKEKVQVQEKQVQVEDKKEQVKEAEKAKENVQVQDKKVDAGKLGDKKEVKVDDKTLPVSEGKGEKLEKVEGDGDKLLGEKGDSVLDNPIPTGEEAFPSEINGNLDPTDPDTGNDDGDDIEKYFLPDVEAPVKSPGTQEEETIKEDIVPRLSNMPKEDDSHFFGYFSILGLICAMGGCVLYHHKQKVLAILLEGRRSRGGRGRRRPSTANYRKLDCTLEEAVTSQCSSNATNVIY
ncbi:GSCOCG00004425001-RA-CDS [Cotesia congregata]|uniref:Uncharacterized protein n=1 Tax=Cotesia congregata TaxID=51543 RepID=A0A8J2EE16_COTCN|nr:GSCOCG00004425001-RA-CDS [Cotesia congregata]CAG5075708.1 Protein of unknown function [Cotesia congregata]